MLNTLYTAVLSGWVRLTIQLHSEEDGAESLEYLVMSTVVIILLVLIGQTFEERGREVVGESLLDLIAQIIRVAGGN